MKNSILVLMVLSTMALFAACSDKSKASKDGHTEMMTDAGPEYTSAYVCPMHCKSSGSDKAGECPVCGMAYVANSDHIADGHQHDHDHDGHDHDDDDGHEH